MASRMLGFSIGLICLLYLQAHSAEWENLDFSRKCDSSETGLCGWDLAWGGEKTCQPETIGGGQCLLIQNDQDGGVGFTEQTMPYSGTRGRAIIRLTARISSEDVAGKGAGITIAFYDSRGGFLTTKDMGYGTFNWIHGTNPWKERTIAAMIPNGTASIRIGAILYGKGKARFDDFRVDIREVTGRQPSQLAIDYVSAACDSIKLHSLVKDSIDIARLRQEALEIAGPATKQAECHLAVEYLLMSLRPHGDLHSFLMNPDEVAAWESDSTSGAGITYCTARVIDSCGYIMVPPFHGGNAALMLAYCDSLQLAFRRLDSMAIKGWLIDLRLNTGGNMEPMLCGLGPIFDSERLGSLVDIYGKAESWYYRNGQYCWENEGLMKATEPTVLGSRRPMAVLLSQQTGSSGEAVAISLIGNGNTRSFGERTWGLTTGNGSFDLPDGARMMLASTIMADRNGKMYRAGVEPDELIDPASAPGGDAVLWRAIDWIKNGK